jgi:hypothetical protein
MEHEFAIAHHAVERYLMGEMSAEERDAFEEHYFACEACSSDLRLTSRFIANAKAVWRDDALAPAKLSVMDWLKAKWLSPAMVAVAAAAIAVVAFQNAVVIPALNAPRALPALTLDLASRAALPRLRPADPLHFYLAPDRPANGDLVWAELSSGSGKVLRGGPVAAPQAQQPFDVYFPGTVQAGRYIITIRSFRNGRPGEQIARQAFEVEKDQEHANQ